jgi:transcriptional regulator with PAS, ATPase and Fis domain
MEANVASNHLARVGDYSRPEPISRSGDLGPRPTSRAHESELTASVIGASPQWRAVLKRASQVAATETTTCLQGESGTGKEVVARFIYEASHHRRGPFIALNCAALPEQLLESELFGFERGAFTGAQQLKPGHIEMASGGVLFLDEITEMALTAQAKFLRVLQEREILRLGGTRPIKVSVRVIAATNQDLRNAVTQGRFREDLYYRINVFDIRIPPLRERGQDILLLAHHFLEEFARANKRPALPLTPGAEDALVTYHWPGNVRELRNVLERASIVCEGPSIDAAHLSFAAAQDFPALSSTDLGVLERHVIAQTMRDVRGNKAQAARRLGISRTQLYIRLRKYGLHHVITQGDWSRLS